MSDAAYLAGLLALSGRLWYDMFRSPQSFALQIAQIGRITQITVSSLYQSKGVP